MIRGGAFHLAAGVVRLASFLVPREEREPWRAEWRGEMVGWWQQHGGRRGMGFTLVRRALLAWGDAWTVRGLHRRGLKTKLDRKETLMDSLLQDSRYALRSFQRRPLLTGVLLLTLALGLGGTTAIFSVLHGVVLSPLPYPEPDRVVQVWPARDSGMSKELLHWLQESTTSYEWLAAWSEGAYRQRLEGRGEMVYGPEVTGEYFHVLGSKAAEGRLFTKGDDAPGVRRAVLSYPFWQERFGGREEALGASLNLMEGEYEIIGVAAHGVDLLQLPFDVALNHEMDPAGEDYDDFYLDVIGRLKSGVTVEAADAELRALTRQWAEAEGVSPEWAASASVVTLHEFLVGDITPAILLLFGAVGFILLIVVANVANLLLARTLAREEEIALRSALGASGGRLTRQMVTETVLLSLFGGAAGLIAAQGVLHGLRTILPPEIPRIQEIHLAPGVMVFTLLVTLCTGLAVGLVPSTLARRGNLRAALGSAGKGTAGRGRHRLRGALVVVEVMLAVVLMAGAGVLIKSFWHTVQQDPGFAAQGLTRVTLLPGSNDWESPEVLEEYYQRMQDGLARVPGVAGVAMVHAVPVVNGGWVMETFPASSPPKEGDPVPLARWRPVSPEYFRLASIELLEGRAFSALDNLQAEPVVILNRSAARSYFGKEEVIGERMRITFEGEQVMRVVGVVEDVRILGLQEGAPRAAYRPYPQSSEALHRIGVTSRSMMIRSSLPLEALEGPLRAALTEYDPLASVLHLETMEHALATSLRQTRVVMLLLSAFAVLALLLGAVGIYGVMGYSVGERTREMGIRLALGAPVRTVLAVVMGGGLRLVALGMLLGLGLTLVLTRFLEGQLFEVKATDPWSLGAAVLVLLTAALLAIYLPARRAGKVDPVEVLRAE